MKHQAKLRFHVISGPKPLSLGIIYWIPRLPMCVCMCIYMYMFNSPQEMCSSSRFKPTIAGVAIYTMISLWLKICFQQPGEKHQNIFSFWELHLLLCNLEHKSGTSKVLYQQSRFYHVTWASLNSISHFLTRVCIHTYVLCCVFVNCALSHTTLFTLKVDKIDYSTIDCFCTVNDLCTNYCFTSETRE